MLASSRSLVLVASAVLVTAAVVAAPAGAAKVAIEDVVAGQQYGRDGRCFAAGSVLAVNGTGFTPRTQVRLAKIRTRTDRAGHFSLLLKVKGGRRAQRRVTLHVRERGGRNSTLLRYWTGVFGVRVPAWARTGPEAIATPGRTVQASAGGYRGRWLYAHYVLAGTPVFSARVARLRGPCGAADFRFMQFPFAAADGLYRVLFSRRSEYRPGAGAEFRGIRVGPGPAPIPLATTPLFTLAGGGVDWAPADGAPAAAAALRSPVRLSALPGGGLLVADRGRVRAIDRVGRITTVAGTGQRGGDGDGGAATAATIDASSLVGLFGGGFLLGQCDPARNPGAFEQPGRVRRVAADGTIVTIAGTGKLGRPPADGTPGIEAAMGCPDDLAVTAQGEVLIVERGRVLRLGADGLVYRIRTRRGIESVAVLRDGAVIVGVRFPCGVFRLDGETMTVVAGDGSEGRRNDDGAQAVDASVCPADLAPAPDGGFYVTDVGFSRLTGSEPRVRQVLPDGRIRTVAGSGRFVPDPSRGDEIRGDGMPATGADLLPAWDLAVLDDGAVVFEEGDRERSHRLVRMIAPAKEGRLAVAVRRDRDRIFDPGAAAAVTITATASATVKVTVLDGTTTVASFAAQVRAGETRIGLPALAARPHTVVLEARDEGGRVAADRAAILPRGWLAEGVARSLFRLMGSTWYDRLLGCKRLGIGRLDCTFKLVGRCHVESVQLGADGRLRWGTYRCPATLSPRRRVALRVIRRDDLICEISDTSCPPPLNGRVADRWLVPRD